MQVGIDSPRTTTSARLSGPPPRATTTARATGVEHVDRFEPAARAKAKKPKKKKAQKQSGLQRLFTGIGEGIKQLGNRLLGGAAVGLSHASNVIGTALGLNKAPRKLTDGERDLLRGVYGNALDLEKVRVVRGGPFTMAVNGEPPSPRAVGNTIYWPTEGPYAALMDDKKGIKLDNRFGARTFVHEAAHNAQFQHAGPGIEAFFLNAGSVLGGRDRNENYEWERVAPATPWARLNPEMQAHLVEDAFDARVDQGGRLVRNGVDFTAYAQEALREVRAGRGFDS